MNLSPNFELSYSFRVRWSFSASGVYNMTSFASSSGVETVSAVATIAIVAVVQLNVRSPPFVSSGSNGPFEMSFVNNGPCIANNVTLQAAILPAGLALLRVKLGEKKMG